MSKPSNLWTTTSLPVLLISCIVLILIILFDTFVQRSANQSIIIPIISPSHISPPSPWEGSISSRQSGWVWIVASSTTAEDAVRIANHYADTLKDIPVDLLVSTTSDTTRYRVAVGHYSSREIAQIGRNQWLHEMPPDAWMLELGL